MRTSGSLLLFSAACAGAWVAGCRVERICLELSETLGLAPSFETNG